jgi:hypothetical protein
MLDTSLTNLADEIQAAITFRDKHLSEVKTLVARFLGRFYRSNAPNLDMNVPENFAWEFVSLTLPLLVYSNPRYRVGTQTGDIGLAMKHAMNKHARDVKLNETLYELATDTLFMWGIAMVSHQPAPGNVEFDDLQVAWPHITRIEPHRWYFDYHAPNLAKARYQGHTFLVDRDDLLNHPHYNAEQVEQLMGNNDPNDEWEKDKQEVGGPERNQIWCHETWVPEVTLDEDELPEWWDDDLPTPEAGYHGTIYTVGEGQGADPEKTDKAFIAPPRPFWGPPHGPFVLFGMLKPPGKVLPLAPLVAVGEQAEELNIHAVAMSESAGNFKRFGVGSTQNPQDGARVKEVKHGEMLLLDDPESFKDATLGGLDPVQPAFVEVLRDRLVRATGMHEGTQGTSTGGTATEMSIIDSWAGVRIDHYRMRFTASVVRLSESISWYIWNGEDVAIPLGPDAERELGVANPVLQGGMRTDDDVQWHELNLDIEPYSMGRISEQVLQKRAQDAMAIVMQVAPAMPQMPWVNWRELMASLFESMNMPGGEDMINYEMLEQLTGGMGGGGEPMPGEQAGEGGAQPNAPGGTAVGAASGPRPAYNVQGATTGMRERSRLAAAGAQSV